MMTKRRHRKANDARVTKRLKIDDEPAEDLNQETFDSDEDNASSDSSSINEYNDDSEAMDGDGGRRLAYKVQGKGLDGMDGNEVDMYEDTGEGSDQDDYSSENPVEDVDIQHEPGHNKLSFQTSTSSRLSMKPKLVMTHSRSLSIPESLPKTVSTSSQIDFASLGITSQLVASLNAMSIRKPTPVQAACIPPLLAGRDCIGNAKTGQGKTVAFAIPILQSLARDPYGIFALVLTPTRELAFQISEQFAVLGAPLNVRTSVVVGGMDMMTQSIELNARPHVVVATPGRLVDLLETCSSMANGEWNLGRVKFLVLDEADRLLSPTFAKELKVIFDKVPKERQTCLFTATLSPAIEALIDAPPRPEKVKPFVHRDSSGVETVETLNQQFILCPSHVREIYLYHLLCNPPESIVHLRRDPPKTGKELRNKGRVTSKKNHAKDRDKEEDIQQPPPTIIFVRKPKTAAYLTHLLQTLEIRCTALHSGLTQPQRLASLNLFRAGVVPVLVCTDVGARGLDIDRVGLVINWDLPSDIANGEERGAEEYVHRVGRTARMGKGGFAVSFVTERVGDEEMMKKIESRINIHLTELVLPEEKVLEKLNQVSTAKRVAHMELYSSSFGKREQVHEKKKSKSMTS